ncbi:hypothetical protein COU54_00755 [Candidatus Pacearchaeota archaeon CG10_big_fil_rev_8_21_14_0_10_31_24]|nr:MAG: hypothetical protein COU54_00755 [Candidatus Pacearchaeota archaeon CG10_big_fil_rev_8_21_14_0_10_31_24]
MKEKDNDFAFCFKKASGLKLISPNDNLVEVYKRKSRSALNMLNSAIEKEEDEWILDTSYYAKYFMAYALFMKAGIKSEIHDCTIFALKSIFSDSGIISSELCKDLSDSRDLRVGSLYYDKDFGKKEILSKADTAPNFCLEVESIVDKLSKEDIAKIRKKFDVLKNDLLE